MRIIGGRAARRVLKAPKGLAVRPTPDLVKQALFNSLGERVIDARVLELFAGSGALGLECLSRGAALVVAVEKAGRPVAMIRQNLAAAQLPRERFELRAQDVFAALRQMAAIGQQFELILADPPFGEKNIGYRSKSLSQALLDDADLPRLLAAGGWFVLGHAKRDVLTLPAHWRQLKTLRHGDSVLEFVEPTAGQATGDAPGA